MAYATLCKFRRHVPESQAADDVVTAVLDRASDEIDALCYGRIRKIGVEKLTAFQKEKLCKAVCFHTAFLCDYGEELQSPLASYGINGVSMSFSSDRIVTQGGITTSNAVMAQLRQSGLASRLIP